jgi:hypothetical protein
MTPALRKIHFFAWLSLAILLPFAWILAIFALSPIPTQEPVHGAMVAALPIVIKSETSDNFVLNLRSNSLNNQLQIEIFIKNPLTNPNTLVSVESREGNIPLKKQLGLLQTRGFYRFDLDSTFTSAHGFDLKITDNIQNKILQNTSF